MIAPVVLVVLVIGPALVCAAVGHRFGYQQGWANGYRHRVRQAERWAQLQHPSTPLVSNVVPLTRAKSRRGR